MKNTAYILYMQYFFALFPLGSLGTEKIATNIILQLQPFVTGTEKLKNVMKTEINNNLYVRLAIKFL